MAARRAVGPATTVRSDDHSILPLSGRDRMSTTPALGDLTAACHTAGVSASPLPVVAVVGPTATGKSALGIGLALALDGEVVNADASQLYRGMDVGTAKLTIAERLGVRHHLLDILEITEEASVADFQARAHEVVDALSAAGRCAVVVGGSGLYLRAVLDELAIPPTDPRVRSRLEAELAAVGSAGLHKRLCALDPAAAAAILPSNGRRVVRALEVVELTGEPFVATMPEPRYRRPSVQLGLRVPRQVLDVRIARRVDQMWQGGLVDEVRRLLGHGLRQAPTASRALGYAQVVRLLDGEIDDATARAETVTATRRLVRRQESWLRRDHRVIWLSACQDDGRPRPAAELLAAALAVVAAARSARP